MTTAEWSECFKLLQADTSTARKARRTVWCARAMLTIARRPRQEGAKQALSLLDADKVGALDAATRRHPDSKKGASRLTGCDGPVAFGFVAARLLLADERVAAHRHVGGPGRRGLEVHGVRARVRQGPQNGAGEHGVVALSQVHPQGRGVGSRRRCVAGQHAAEIPHQRRADERVAAAWARANTEP